MVDFHNTRSLFTLKGHGPCLKIIERFLTTVELGSNSIVVMIYVIDSAEIDNEMIIELIPP